MQFERTLHKSISKLSGFFTLTDRIFVTFLRSSGLFGTVDPRTDQKLPIPIFVLPDKVNRKMQNKKHYLQGHRVK
jgi:hypothetical protein